MNVVAIFKLWRLNEMKEGEIFMFGNYNPFFDYNECNDDQDNMPEWKVDEYGKRYRMIGNIKEYAPMITTTFGTFYKDDLADIQKNLKAESEKRRIEEAELRLSMKTNMDCPFKFFHGNGNTECEKTCSFYIESGCVFAKASNEPTNDTIGKHCPFVK